MNAAMTDLWTMHCVALSCLPVSQPRLSRASFSVGVFLVRVPNLYFGTIQLGNLTSNVPLTDGDGNDGNDDDDCDDDNDQLALKPGV